MTKWPVLFTTVGFCLVTLLLANVSLAQSIDTSTSPATTASKTSEDRYDNFIHQVGKIGPTQVTLRDQASLDVPQGFAFIPEEPAKKVMQNMGNEADENFLGLIFPAKEDIWFISVEYFPSGYIKDDDAKTWDADKLLSDIQQNTEESNKQRTQKGMPPLEIVGWVEKPHYDESTHRLIWSIAARDKGSADNAKNIINYRTLMLGREGYISMIMVTDLAAIDAEKPIANLLLSKLNFGSGKRYADFNSSTDHVAEYGLAALVAGVAAQKLGLFALAAAFVAKFINIKVGMVTIAAFFAAIRKKFGGKKAKQNVALNTPTSPPQGASDSDLPQ